MQDPSHFVHTSLIDGVQPSDFQDDCLAKSRLICVIQITLLYLICFCVSSFFLGINTQNLLEDCEHLILSSFHKEDSLPVYFHESTDMLICDPLDFDLEEYFQVHTYIIPPFIPSTIPPNNPKTIQIPSSLVDSSLVSYAVIFILHGLNYFLYFSGWLSMTLVIFVMILNMFVYFLNTYGSYLMSIHQS